MDKSLGRRRIFGWMLRWTDFQEFGQACVSFEPVVEISIGQVPKPKFEWIYDGAIRSGERVTVQSMEI